MDSNVPPPAVKRQSNAVVALAVAFALICSLLLFLISGWFVVWVGAALALIVVIGFLHYKIWGQRGGSPSWDSNRQDPNLPG